MRGGSLTDRRRWWRVSLGWTLASGGVLGFATPVDAQIVVDDRVVETQAAGPCTSLLTTGEQRYVDCGNGTVLDAATNLLWLRNASCGDLGTAGIDTWVDAQRDVADLEEGLCDLTDGSQPGDWRLPTTEEWELTVRFAEFEDCVFGGKGGSPALTGDTGLTCFGDGSSSSFEGVMSENYWASGADPLDPTDAEVMSLLTGQPGIQDKDSFLDASRIWPVRLGGGPAAAAPVQVEGFDVETQADSPCYDDAGTGEERYVDCGDGTVLDLFTRLLWLEDATCAELLGTDAEGRGDWPTAKSAVAQLAEPLCGLSDGSQPGDWRLPTEVEWEVTTDRAQALGCTSPGVNEPPALTDITGTMCFVDGLSPFDGVVALAGYWAAVASDFNPDGARTLVMNQAIVAVDSKNRLSTRIWPVREWK